MPKLRDFSEVWLIDFEFSAPAGERPTVACMVARELKSGRLLRLTDVELRNMRTCPIRTGDDVLFVAYFSSAEWDCFLSLGWELPSRILDLYVEFKNSLNGGRPLLNWSLLGALAQYGLDALDASEKEEMRELAIRGGPYTDDEMNALLDYCQTDVDSLARLLPKMLDDIDLPRALLRGRYMAAVSKMQHCGSPIDMPSLELLRNNWNSIKQKLIAEVDKDYGVYEGTTFKRVRFEKWLVINRIPWPHSDGGKLKLDEKTFKQMSNRHASIAPLYELRRALSTLKLESLAVGRDGRNRCMLSPFSARTSRNQPGNSRFIFGPSRWLRALIKPGEGRAVAYIDWSQQELGIAAALSGDTKMMDAYRSGDPYLAFAKQAGAVPADATKASHPDERAAYKACALGVQYGLSEYGLSQNLGKPKAFARNLLQMHRETYRSFWRWSQNNVDTAMLSGRIQTVFGWRIHSGTDSNPRSLANFKCQANGAEMLRLACCLMTENGIDVCCPVHDAILIEAPLGEIEKVVARARRYMAEASRIVLDGFELQTDVDIVRYPDRYMDSRGEVMWNRIMELCNEAL